MQGFNWEFTPEVLPNGITLWTLPVPWVNFTSYRMLFEMGYLDDPVGKEGLTHFLEHQLFNISSRPRGKERKMLTSWFADQGCSLNANTSFDRILIEADILASRTDLLGAFWELVTAPQVTVDYKAEREVIVAGEMHDRCRIPQIDLLEQAQQVGLLGPEFGQYFHPSKWLGTAESMARIDGKDLESAWVRFRQLCSHVVVAGKMNPEIRDRVSLLPVFKSLSRSFEIKAPNSPIIEDAISMTSMVGQIGWPKAVLKCKFVIKTDDWHQCARHDVLQDIIYDDLLQILRSELGCVYALRAHRERLIPGMYTYGLEVSMAPEDVDRVQDIFSDYFARMIIDDVERRLAQFKERGEIFDPSVENVVDAFVEQLEMARGYCTKSQRRGIVNAVTSDQIATTWDCCYRSRFQLRTLIP